MIGGYGSGPRVAVSGTAGRGARGERGRVEAQDVREVQDVWEVREVREVQDVWEVRDVGEVRDVRDACMSSSSKPDRPRSGRPVTTPCAFCAMHTPQLRCAPFAQNTPDSRGWIPAGRSRVARCTHELRICTRGCNGTQRQDKIEGLNHRVAHGDRGA